MKIFRRAVLAVFISGMVAGCQPGAVKESPVTLTPVSEDPVASKNPIFEGGLVCQLPFKPDGTLSDSPGGTYRRCVVQLAYLLTERHWTEGVCETRPALQVTPLEEPCPTTLRWLTGAHDEKLTFFHVLDVDVLRQGRAHSPLLEKHISELDGKPIWRVLAPFHNRGRGWWGAPEDVLIFEFYRQDPDTGARPLEIPSAARWVPGHGWQPWGWVLESEPEWTFAIGVIEGGRPMGVRLMFKPEPRFEDVLPGVAEEGTRERRLPQVLWRNRMALNAKNRTLPKVIAESKTSDLSDLVLRIERSTLEVAHEMEACKDKVQRMIESNGGDTTQLSNLVHAYQERLVIWKPILAAVKEELANRAK